LRKAFSEELAQDMLGQCALDGEQENGVTDCESAERASASVT
jgi:hypothetical protein